MKKSFSKILFSVPIIVSVLFFGSLYIVSASFNEQINYQGKLTDNNDITVSDGSYNFRFRLCTTSDCSGGSDPIWTETHCYSPDNGATCNGTGTDQRVSVTSGLFSILLGSITSLSSVDFNQILWLEVQIGGSGTTPSSWETLTPRKKLGASPAAFEAKQLAGATWASPGTIGSTIPNTGAFTTLDISGLGTFSYIPQGAGVGQGSLYINPSTATADYTLFGVAVGGSEKFRVDAEGDLSIAGDLTVTGGDTGTFSSVTMADSGWIGLGAFKGRIAYTDSTTDYVIFSDAYVGIGTTVPNKRLQVDSTGAQLRLGYEGYSSTYYADFTMSTTDLTIATPTTRNIVLNADGGVLLKASGGTATAASQDVIVGLSSGAGNPEFAIKAGTTTFLGAFAGSQQKVAVGSGVDTSIGAKLQVIGDTYISGNVGIGTTGPLSRLTVDPTGTNATGDANYGTWLYGADTSNSKFALAATGSDGAASHGFFVRNDGNVGIGAASPSAKLDIAGDVIISGSSRYLNFDTSSGAAGYGFRDHSGVIEYKDSSDTKWFSLKTICPETVRDSDGNTYNVVQIGSQCWMKENLNVGTRVDGANEQNNDSVLEKYCYSDDEANCTSRGGLYQWAEAMDLPYSCNTSDCSGSINTPHQGICPTGWHIPTHDEWTDLERQVCADNGNDNCATTFPKDTSTTGWLGTDEGDSLKTAEDCYGGSNCGTSGFEALLAGYRDTNGFFNYWGTLTYFWSSAEYSSFYAWKRFLYLYEARVYRLTYPKANGFSVRCLKDSSDYYDYSDYVAANDHLTITADDDGDSTGEIRFNIGTSQVGVIDNSGNVGIGTTGFGTNAAGVLGIGNGTAPTSSPADMVQLYAKDVTNSSELFVLDEAGNEKQLSPHDPITGEWIFYSRNVTTGRELRVEMEQLVKYLDERFGTNFVQEFQDGQLIEEDGTIGDGTVDGVTDDGSSILSLFVQKVKDTSAQVGLFIKNGIAYVRELFAEQVTTKKLTTKKLCIDDVCVNKEQLKELLDIADNKNTNDTNDIDSTDTGDTAGTGAGNTGNTEGDTGGSQEIEFSVNLSANPSSGEIPLSADLTASVTTNTSVEDGVTYYFKCNRFSSWGEPTTVRNLTYTAEDICTYDEPGLFTAEVKVELFDLSAINTSTIETTSPPADGQ